MNSYKRISTIVGWTVFGIAALVYYLTAERTGSLWDCGEFILGAYKLQVVHPPGAPLFLIIARMFTWVAEVFSDNPEDIAFAMNFMSGIVTAFAAAFGAWSTMGLGKLAMVGRNNEPDLGQRIALGGAGLVAGLSITFATSIWFSAVEGEVYAMSVFFMAMAFWAGVKWYTLPDEPHADRWLIFTLYAVGLSIGVHLLSMLVIPAVALLYYFKKYENPTWLGMGLAALAGVGVIGLIQFLIVTGVPKLWAMYDIFAVNTLGMPFNSGLIFTFLTLAGIMGYGLYWAYKNNNGLVQKLVVAVFLLVTAYTSYGVVVIRAQASTPINMNTPDDPTRLIPYLNREQYGGRALLRGPHFEGRPSKYEYEDRMGRDGDRYEVIDRKISVVYNNADKMLFPRMADPSQNRPAIYKQWMGLNQNNALPRGRPNQADNLSFFWRYQVNWMYWRYFFWNFSGRQNGKQGYYPWDKSRGHWISGVSFIDNMKLDYSQSSLTEIDYNDKARNTYFLLPFLFGLLGLIWQARKGRNEFFVLLAFFVITGVGLIVYLNPPPNEPRERDYVFAGSFFVYCFWIGMGVLALFEVLRQRAKLSGPIAGGIATALVFIAPFLMGTQNFDDHDRSEHYGSRDYASNFLNSLEEDAIIFTYGDNDTYPLWYAQEVENIRPDVRVVNLSLIAVDWYIDLLRRKVNDSDPIKLSLQPDDIRGSKRNQVLFNKTSGQMTLEQFMTFLSEEHPLPLQSGELTETYAPTDDVFLPINKQRAVQSGLVDAAETAQIVDRIPIGIKGRRTINKDDIAILDIIANNFYDRPIYFSVTTQARKMMGFNEYCQLEGLALRLIPIKSTPNRQYGQMLGAGRVDTDEVLDNVLNKFRWGNFDQEDLFIDQSYAPSIQSMQFLMVRTAEQLLRDNRKEDALKLADQYFASFPDFNFPYDYQTNYMLTIYIQAGAYDKAKPHMDILAENLADKLRFLGSLKPRTLQNSTFFSTDNSNTRQAATSLLSLAQQTGDQETLQRYQALLGSYLNIQSPPQNTPLRD